MQGFMDALKPFVEGLGAEPWMYPILFAFGIGHQYAKGMLPWWHAKHSLTSAGLLAAVFGTLALIDHQHGALEAGAHYLALFAAALLAEGVMTKLAEVLPFVPKNNEWVKNTKEAK